MSIFVCTECEREVPNPYEQFSERREFRRMDCKERRHSWTVRLLCRDCVDAIANAYHGTVEQGTLL